MWKGIPKNIEDYAGFVYEITNNIEDKKYIGKKLFWSRRRLKPLKGKKNGRIKIVESDWKDYWGSCKELHKDIEKGQKRNFSRRILHCYSTRWECSYFEAKEQFDRGVLLRSDYYNGIIQCRLRGRK